MDDLIHKAIHSIKENPENIEAILSALFSEAYEEGYSHGYGNGLGQGSEYNP